MITLIQFGYISSCRAAQSKAGLSDLRAIAGTKAQKNRREAAGSYHTTSNLWGSWRCIRTRSEVGLRAAECNPQRLGAYARANSRE